VRCPGQGRRCKAIYETCACSAPDMQAGNRQSSGAAFSTAMMLRLQLQYAHGAESLKQGWRKAVWQRYRRTGDQNIRDRRRKPLRRVSRRRSMQCPQRDAERVRGGQPEEESPEQPRQHQREDRGQRTGRKLFLFFLKGGRQRSVSCQRRNSRVWHWRIWCKWTGLNSVPASGQHSVIHMLS